MTIVSLVPILIFRKAPPTVKELTPKTEPCRKSILDGIEAISVSFTQISVANAPLFEPRPGALIIVPKTLSPTEN